MTDAEEPTNRKIYPQPHPKWKKKRDLITHSPLWFHANFAFNWQKNLRDTFQRWKNTTYTRIGDVRKVVGRHLHHLHWDGLPPRVTIYTIYTRIVEVWVVVLRHFHNLHLFHWDWGKPLTPSNPFTPFTPFTLGLMDTINTIKSIYTIYTIYTWVEGHHSHHQIHLHHLHLGWGTPFTPSNPFTPFTPEQGC